MTEKLYFIELGFHGYVDLCIIEGITKDDFEKILKERNKERKDECENGDGTHIDGFYDGMAYKVEKLGGKLTAVTDNNVIVDY